MKKLEVRLINSSLNVEDDSLVVEGLVPSFGGARRVRVRISRGAWQSHQYKEREKNGRQSHSRCLGRS